jgi:hypothetical protein
MRNNNHQHSPICMRVKAATNVRLLGDYALTDRPLVRPAPSDRLASPPWPLSKQRRLCPPPRLSFQAMSTVRPAPKAAKRRVATLQPLLLGAHVRLHSKDVTGVIIGSIDSSRVRVRWDHTGEVTTCPRAKLAPLR